MKQANRPDTPKTREEDARSAFLSAFLWLLGAAFLDIAALVCVYLGLIALEGTTLAFVVILTLYTCISIAPCRKAYQTWQEAKSRL